jgi:hypothetical protein
LVIENYNEDHSFGEEIINKMKGLLDRVIPTDFIIKAIVWILGEIGSSLYADD